MAHTMTLVSQNATSSDQYLHTFDVVASVNFGNPYSAITRAELLALLNPRLAAIRADVQAAAIVAVLVGNSEDGHLFCQWDEANAQIEAQVLDPGTVSAIPSVAWSDALAAAPAHTFTIPAGTFAIAAEGTAGFAGPLELQYTAAGAAGEARYTVGTRLIETLAADACTEIRALLLTPGAASVAPAFAAPAADQSAAARDFVCFMRCTRA
jgi:hypothetical protein